MTVFGEHHVAQLESIGAHLPAEFFRYDGLFPCLWRVQTQQPTAVYRQGYRLGVWHHLHCLQIEAQRLVRHIFEAFSDGRGRECALAALAVGGQRDGMAVHPNHSGMGGKALVLVDGVSVEIGDEAQVELVPAAHAETSAVAIEARLWPAGALRCHQRVGVAGSDREGSAQVELPEQTVGRLTCCLILGLNPETGAEDFESVVVGPDQAVEVFPSTAFGSDAHPGSPLAMNPLSMNAVTVSSTSSLMSDDSTP